MALTNLEMMMEDMEPKTVGTGLLARLRAYWPIIVSIGCLLLWGVTSSVSAALSLATIQSDVELNKEKVGAISKEMKVQDKTSQDTSDRLLKVEIEVNHIRVYQKENHKEIKQQLNTMQQDIKRMSD